MTVKISQLPAGAALTGVEDVPIVQSSTTVRVLMSAIGAYVRGLFTTTPLTIAEGGTGASTTVLARAALGAAASGANSDITSLLGLTTALSIAQGGTGQKTQADALAALLGSSQVPIANGGTGVATAALAIAALGGLPLAGGTMIGNLTLANAPSADLMAATKKYVDDVKPTGTLAAAGGVNFSNGLQLRWGGVNTINTGDTNVTFSPAFTTACFVVVATSETTSGALSANTATISSTGFMANCFDTSNLRNQATLQYIAVGH